MTLNTLTICFVLAAWVGVPFGYATIQPISKAVSNRTEARKYFPSDFLCLFLVLLLTVATMSGALKEFAATVAVGIPAILMLIAVYTWWRGVTVLSSLRIYGELRRAAFMLAVLPVAILVPALLFPAAAFSVSYLRSPDHIALRGALAIAGIVAISYGFRLVSLWILNGQADVHQTRELRS